MGEQMDFLDLVMVQSLCVLWSDGAGKLFLLANNTTSMVQVPFFLLWEILPSPVYSTFFLFFSTGFLP